MSVVMVSAQGQIVLPQDVRRALGLYEGDRLGVILQENRLVLTPLVSSSQRGWRRWRGSLAGTRALQEHLAEHADEVRRERLP